MLRFQANFASSSKRETTMEQPMDELTNLADLLSGLPPGVLVLILILAAFGLAAYAIYAVVTVAKKER
ncbi:hypothetical protein L1965_00270 [Paracoccus sp. EGI L200073]|nr:hypothetical protein [Paracoccus salsus]